MGRAMRTTTRAQWQRVGDERGWRVAYLAGSRYPGFPVRCYRAAERQDLWRESHVAFIRI